MKYTNYDFEHSGSSNTKIVSEIFYENKLNVIAQQIVMTRPAECRSPTSESVLPSAKKFRST